MSERTNDEKLRILQERLAQIKQKQETSTISNKREKENPATNSEEITSKENNNKTITGFIKYLAIIIIIFYGATYIFNTLNAKKNVKNETVFVFKYNLNMTGEEISIIASFKDETEAMLMVDELIIKGYKSDYFFLPDHSNSLERIYKVYIGPYENEKETNQWTKNLELDFETIKINQN